MKTEDIEGIIKAMIGLDGVEIMTSREQWEEFTPFDSAVVDLYDAAMKAMRNGNFDAKVLISINDKFDVAAREFVNKLTFGYDQVGRKVTFEQLFGEMKAVRPEYLPYLCAKMLMLWSIERKLRIIREEELGIKKKYEAVRIMSS
jgi:hypothetical protein